MNRAATAQGSNRTFMELKCAKSAIIYTSAACSNRTFMELKYGYHFRFAFDDVF